jgi:hypothetical protein
VSLNLWQRVESRLQRIIDFPRFYSNINPSQVTLPLYFRTNKTIGGLTDYAEYATCVNGNSNGVAASKISVIHRHRHQERISISGTSWRHHAYNTGTVRSA